MLFLGRLNRRKGVDVLLDAFAQLLPGADTALVIAGDGDERVMLETQCAELGLTVRVHFVGAVGGDAKVWLLQNARCVVIPSRDWEAFPLVVLESFAAGKPVVGTRIAGLEDLIEPERTGLLVPPESPQSLAEALTFLMRDESAARDMGQHARHVVREFDWRNIAQQHLRLYRRLCGLPHGEALASVTLGDVAPVPLGQNVSTTPASRAELAAVSGRLPRLRSCNRVQALRHAILPRIDRGPRSSTLLSLDGTRIKVSCIARSTHSPVVYGHSQNFALGNSGDRRASGLLCGTRPERITGNVASR